MTLRKTWLEVCLNGGWTRRHQPLIPIAPAEIVAEGIAAVRAGAAIVHLHAYDVASGRQRDDADIYEAIISGIRAEVDAIVYPTIPHLEPGPDAAERTRRRYGASEALGRRGLLEWTVVDPGTVNLVHYDAIAIGREGSVYLNTESDIRAGLDLARRYRCHPMARWEFPTGATAPAPTQQAIASHSSISSPPIRPRSRAISRRAAYGRQPRRCTNTSPD
jgi:3-keto-5-aminohexanoate cleavage enzyme